MKGTGLVIALAIGLALLRLIHLAADTPPGLSTSAAPYVDEGYRTLSPRNLVLFGTTHWHPKDVYAGWAGGPSPITQWAFHTSFRLFGTSIEAARGVTILFFALLLGGFVWAMSSRYLPGLILGGLALLGLESNLFFFSRIALLEVPIAALLYCLLFVFARLKPHRTVAPLLMALPTSVLLVFGVKFSALVYLTPILLASSFYFLRDQRCRRWLLDWRYLTLGAAGFAVVLAITRDQWKPALAMVGSRIHLVPSDIATRIIENPLVTSSPLLIAAGLLCAIHGLICRPDLYLGTIYRFSLVMLVLLGIPIVALFMYDPLRYYIPLLPAYGLVVLEWVHLGCWKFRGKVVAAALLVMLPLFVVQNARSLGSFFLAPSYEARDIRNELAELLPEDSIVAGVWAPFITLGTSFKSLYVAGAANRAEMLPELAPDYVLQTVGNENSEHMLRAVEKTRGMSIGPSIYESKYNERNVVLYPLLYNWRSSASLRRGPFAIGRALARAGDPEAAEPWLRRSLLERRKADPIVPLRIAESQGELGACLLRLGRHAEAEGLLLAAHESFRPDGSTPARALARLSLIRLVELYEGWNRPQRSAEYRGLLTS